jgi:hypothetical protein
VRDNDDIMSIPERYDLTAEARSHLVFHHRRFAFLLEIVDSLRSGFGTGPTGAGMRILDVGPHLQTHLLRQRYPDALVDSLGLEALVLSPTSRMLEPREGERHVLFDLNDTHNRACWPSIGTYHAVVMAEVIEHLYASPVTVLECVKTWLSDDGVLVLQTPNAVALHQRVKLLIGRSPSEPLRHARANLGHIHEYTIEELEDAVAAAGLEPIWHSVRNYFSLSGPPALLYRVVGGLLPPRARLGITMCIRRRG